jgi:hypothetical protein
MNVKKKSEHEKRVDYCGEKRKKKKDQPTTEIRLLRLDKESCRLIVIFEKNRSEPFCRRRNPMHLSFRRCKRINVRFLQ